MKYKNNRGFEEAKKESNSIKPYTTRILMQYDGDPQANLDRMISVYKASGGDYEVVYEENLPELLALCLGDEDVPNGSKKVGRKKKESSFDTNMRYLSDLLMRGVHIYFGE